MHIKYDLWKHLMWIISALYPHSCVSSSLWDFSKVTFPMPLCWCVCVCACVCVRVWIGGSFEKSEMSIYHSQGLGVATRLPFSSLGCLLYTYCMCFSHDQQTGRNQNAGLDAWPQTAPLPLCSDKLPSSKSWSLSTIEKDQLEMIMETHIFALGTRSVQH